MAAWAATLRRIIFAGLIGAYIYGFSSHHLFGQRIWTPLGWRRLAEFAIASTVLAILIYIWRRTLLVPIAVGMGLLYGISAVGVQAPATVLLVLFSGWLLGRALMQMPEPGVRGAVDELLAALAGVCVFAAFTGFAVFFRINYGAVYFAILLMPLIWRRRDVRECGRLVLSSIGPLQWAKPEAWAAAALLTSVMFAQWLTVLKPECSVDGLAVHLAAPAWVAAHHSWEFDFQRLIWAVLPMNGDWAYTFVYLMGGEHAARMLNFSMFALTAALLFATVRRWAKPELAALLVAAFASSPVAQLETGSLFIDNAWSAMLFGAVVAVVRARQTGNTSHLIFAGVFLGSAMATKPATFAYLVPVAGLMFVEIVRRARRSELRPATVLLCCACFLAIALPPYVNAWARTGNPIYPYLNTTFHSPYYDQVTPLREGRFHAPLSWRTLFDLTFESHKFFEGQDGGFAFQYLLLAPFCAMYLRRDWPFAAWAGLAAGLFGFTATFARAANLRYIYPTLPMLLLPIAIALTRVGDPLLRRASGSAVAVAIVLNVCFFGASGWYHKGFYLNALFTVRETERYIDETCPGRRVVDYLNMTAPNDPAGFLAGEFIAGLRGPAWTNSWHSPAFETELQAAKSTADVLKAANTRSIEYFVAPDPSNPFEKMTPLLWAFLGEYTRPEFRHEGYYVARLTPVGRTGGAAGACDDSRIRYSPGEWVCNASESAMVASRPGAEFRLDFQGRQVTFVFTKGPDRGEAEVTIDGSSHGVVEQYFPSREQEFITYRQRTAGAHSVVVRVLAKRHYLSTGSVVGVMQLTVN